MEKMGIWMTSITDQLILLSDHLIQIWYILGVVVVWLVALSAIVYLCLLEKLK